jgi:hypothetical protein
MKPPNQFRENAENCAELALKAPDEPSKARYKRMEAAWQALAQEQDWLDGEIDPERVVSNRIQPRPPLASKNDPTPVVV